MDSQVLLHKQRFTDFFNTDNLTNWLSTIEEVSYSDDTSIEVLHQLADSNSFKDIEKKLLQLENTFYYTSSQVEKNKGTHVLDVFKTFNEIVFELSKQISEFKLSLCNFDATSAYEIESELLENAKNIKLREVGVVGTDRFRQILGMKYERKNKLAHWHLTDCLHNIVGCFHSILGLVKSSKDELHEICDFDKDRNNTHSFMS